MIPASALRGIPLDGSVADVLDTVMLREVERGWRVHDRDARRRS
jgi:hypothetical protein